MFSPGSLPEGKGVSKNRVAEKRGFFRFFEIVFSQIWKLITVNLLFLLCSIPIVTIGPATAGLTYVTRCIARERHTFAASDFFEYFKKNFGKSFAVGIINLLVTVILACDIRYCYIIMTGWVRIATVIAFSLILVLFIFVTYYVNLLLVTFDIAIPKMYRNALNFAVLGIKSNLVASISLLVIYFIVFALCSLIGWLGIVVFIILILLFIPAIRSVIIAYCTFDPVKKYMIDPYYKLHPNEDIPLRYSLGLLSEKEAFGKSENVFADLVKKDENEC